MKADPPIALLDACILYPYTLRDTFLRLAKRLLYRPRWTDEINEEWVRNLLANQKVNYGDEAIRRTVHLMNSAFELSRIDKHLYQPLIPRLDLDDANDRHVLAAAIAGEVDFLVTANIRDFPAVKTSSFKGKVVTPDDFLVLLIDKNIGQVVKAIEDQSAGMIKWPKSPVEIVKTLEKVGLKRSAKILLEQFHTP
jgi:hypothetical protein